MTGVVFTFDALHCQKKLWQRSRSSGNDYLVKVKTNQPKLHKQIETESNQQIPRQKVEEHEKTRDRNSYRLIEVFELPEKLDQKWIGAGCVIKVERSGTRGNEPYQTYQLLSLFFITSISPRSQMVFEDIG